MNSPRGLSLAGCAGAAAGWLYAWLPSLLPPGTVLLGIRAGVCAALGYGLALIVTAMVRAISGRPVRGPQGRARIVLFWAAAAVALAGGLVLSTFLRAQALALGAGGWIPQPVVSALIGLVTALLALAAARGVRASWLKIRAALMHRRESIGATAAGAVAAVSICAIAVIVVAGAAALTVAAFNSIDQSTTGQTAPASDQRSGGPGSLIPWTTLGRQGRDFVAGGQDLATIRTFAGLASAPTTAARAQLATDDMLRAGGAEADVWVGITSTGNGFVDPVAASAAETVIAGTPAGSSALVAMQYSTLPSWIAMFAAGGQARSAGEELYQAMARARDQLPEGHRPELVLYGESLGAYGSAAPFSADSPDQLVGRVDGALWVGPPAATEPITTWTDDGVPPIWQPTVGAGRSVRYAADAEVVAGVGQAQPWEPRLLVLQHATDPVVWFDTPIAWRPPKWLREPRGPGVRSGTRWAPLFLFLSVGFDLPQAVNMPAGVGHDYSDELEAAWREVLQRPPLP